MDAFLKPPASSPLQTLYNSNVGKTTATKAKSSDGGVERMYQKKTQLEHILLRPDTYIGSVETVTESMWVYDQEADKIVKRDTTYVPGLFKIFDEILVNAADNKQKDKTMDCIKVDIDAENNVITIYNNGVGIPIVVHKDENMYVPTMIFGHLLTSSNYNDDEKKVTGGRNGYGAKLCNIFSTKFTVETSSQEYNKSFKQTWTENMSTSTTATIKTTNAKDFTKITFSPDLKKFKMTSLDKDIVGLFSRRAYDVAGTTKGVKVFLNGKRIMVKNFNEYVQQYTQNATDDHGTPIKVVYEMVNPRWEIAITVSDRGFQQVSFVNSIATTKGGRHVDYVADHIVTKIVEVIKKKNKGGHTIRPLQVKNHMWVFVNCLIENPTFDSQTKENMTLQAKSFGSKCDFSDKFMSQVQKSGLVESIQSWMNYKQLTKLDGKCYKTKHSKLRGIPKLEDANNAGTKNSSDCTLILTEGDSAKSLAVSGLGVVGRDKYGVFPLRGKLLNVREATHKQILENAEINNLIKILGLQYKKKYTKVEDLKTLRYGRLMIMTDQDQDGSHIKGLIINFIHHNWPDLLQLPFLEEFITPIVKVTKGGQSLSFYSIPEFEEWKQETENFHTWKIKYYKGLGTSTTKEAKEYFTDMARHRIRFKYTGAVDDESVRLAFSKKMIEQRKDWLTNGLEERKQRREQGLPEIYLYEKNTKAVSYEDFVNKELILFSNMDNERSIPSLVDGLKPGQRKVLFVCLKRNLRKEVKVSELTGSVSEQSAYHHGEASLLSTIINLAQNFVGSNNINILQPIGQFGTRLQGGKDAASPRYIFTALSSLTRHLFNIKDDPILHYLNDDNKKIQPEYYLPIIPLVLVNGADGIGTGWMTKVPNYNPRELVANIKHLLAGEPLEEMKPWFKNFFGGMDFLEPQKYVSSGVVSVIDRQTVEITELPIRTWTQNYKESVLEPMLYGSEKSPISITDYKEYNTDTSVRFVVSMAEDILEKAERDGLHSFFKLFTNINTSSMVLFDRNGCLKRYETANDILKEFYEIRFEYYVKRKAYMEGLLLAESRLLSNQARFVLEKIDGIILIENRKKAEVIKQLGERGYDADPVKAWHKQLKAVEAADDIVDEDSNSEAEKEEEVTDFGYLYSMAMLSLTKEKKEELLAKRDEKLVELRDLQSKSPSDMWREDLDAFLEELDLVEAKEQEDEAAGAVKPSKKGKMAAAVKKKPLKSLKEETRPSPLGRIVMPRIDAVKRKAERTAGTTTAGIKRVRKAPVKSLKTAAGKKTDDSVTSSENDGTPKVKRVRKAPVKAVKTAATNKKKDSVPSSESDEVLPLAERIKKAAASKTTKGMKQSTLNFGRKQSVKESNTSDDFFSPSNKSDDEFEHPKTLPKRAAAKKQVVQPLLNITCTSDESEDDASEDEWIESSPVNKKKKSGSESGPSAVSGRKTAKQITLDTDEEVNEIDSSQPAEDDDKLDSPEPAKVLQKKVVVEDDENDSDESFKITKAVAKKRGRKEVMDSSSEDYQPTIKKKLAPRKQTATKLTRTKKTIVLSDSDGDSEPVVTRPKSTRPRKVYNYSDSDE
uniref:DNA topoisomerase 2 n=1 Tax=Strigamia maritima TaxID=126957 RepID=T1JG36_STRMM